MAELESVAHYRIARRLGAGGMGEVYLGHDERLDRPVAIKRLRNRDDIRADVRERFHREARVAAKLNHAGIVHVYDVVRDGDTDCIVMEYVEGTTLRQYRKSRRPDVAEVVRLARQIAAAMAEAHDHDIVHRDLKSENVLITRDGKAKITDFGIAKVMGGDQLTADGAVLGTYRAMSPEQATGKPVGPRSDLFSFGVLLYETLSGVTPFKAENPLAMLDRIVNQQPVPIAERVPSAPEDLTRLVEQLLQKQPLLRPRGFRRSGCRAGRYRRPARRPRHGQRDGFESSRRARPSCRARSPAPRCRRPARRGRRLSRPGHPVSNIPTACRRVAAGSCFWPLAGIAVASTGGVTAYMAWPDSPEPDPATEPFYVAVRAPRVRSGDDAGLMADALRHAAVRGLSELDDIAVLSGDDVDRVDSGSLRDLARALAVDELITSDLRCDARACSIALSWIRGDGSVRKTESFDVPKNDFRRSAETIATHVQRGYSERAAHAGRLDLRITSAGYKRFLMLYRAHSHKDPPWRSARSWLS